MNLIVLMKKCIILLICIGQFQEKNRMYTSAFTVMMKHSINDKTLKIIIFAIHMRYSPIRRR